MKDRVSPVVELEKRFAALSVYQTSEVALMMFAPVIGLVIGVVAKLMTPGRDPGTIVVMLLLGLVGSIVGGLLGIALGGNDQGDPASLFMSAIGAVLFVFAYRALRKPKTT